MSKLTDEEVLAMPPMEFQRFLLSYSGRMARILKNIGEYQLNTMGDLVRVSQELVDEYDSYALRFNVEDGKVVKI